jgi:phosphoglycerate dehydrogenase-like enzyme
MAKTNLLVIAPADHYSLCNLAPLRDSSEISASADQEELERLAPRAEVILFTSLTPKPVDLARIWRQAKSPRWMHSLSTGVENILFPELLSSAVRVTNARGVFKRALAEFAMLGILFHYKKARLLVDNQRRHRWGDFNVKTPSQRVMGVVGFGEIGRECALLAKGLGMKIHAVRRNAEKSAHDPLLDRLFKPEELHAMLAGVDVLICAAPLTRETRHMIGEAQLQVMKPAAIIINVGRGPVIDQAALIRALLDGRLGGAALDVFEEEPLPENSPLWDMDNVLISPHCTDRTCDPDWLDLTMQVFVDNFYRYLQGEALLNLVDKQAGY